MGTGVQNLDWKRVIFTDECSLELNGRPARSWTIRAPGEEYLPAHIDTPFKSDCRTIIIWGAIAYDEKFPLLRLPLLPARQVNGVRPAPETLNVAKYAEWVLEERIAPYVEEVKADFEDDEVYVSEDEAPVHRGEPATSVREELGITPICHPASSPNLNPVDYVWNLMKKNFC